MLYTINVGSEAGTGELTEGEKLAVYYHDLFDFPLSFADLVRWTAGEPHQFSNIERPISKKGGYYFVEGKDGIIYKRALRKRISLKKISQARKAAKLISFLPTVKLVAVTGSLAMENATDDSDIDLMIVTSRGALWTSRAFTYLLICLFGIKKRIPNSNYQKDALCLNMWLDEGDLVWKKSDRNIYTAHEIGQICPLVNKDKSYEKFIFRNKWILKYWPHSVKIENCKLKNENFSRGPNFIEQLAFKLQYLYMKPKISREVITKTRAIFHPHDWGKVVLPHFT